jgi:hypothetical protein
LPLGCQPPKNENFRGECRDSHWRGSAGPGYLVGRSGQPYPPFFALGCRAHERAARCLSGPTVLRGTTRNLPPHVRLSARRCAFYDPVRLFPFVRILKNSPFPRVFLPKVRRECRVPAPNDMRQRTLTHSTPSVVMRFAGASQRCSGWCQAAEAIVVALSKSLIRRVAANHCAKM